MQLNRTEIPEKVAHHIDADRPVAHVNTLWPPSPDYTVLTWLGRTEEWWAYFEEADLRDYVANPRDDKPTQVLAKVIAPRDIIAYSINRSWGPNNDTVIHGVSINNDTVLIRPETLESDSDLVLSITEALESPSTRTGPIPVGKGKRLMAGLLSLIQRANLVVQLGDSQGRVKVSEYGDTDEAFHIYLGGPSFRGRVAYLDGNLILHRTVGHRAKFNLKGTLTVEGSKGGQTWAKIEDLPWINQVASLTSRVTEEVLAKRLESTVHWSSTSITGTI